MPKTDFTAQSAAKSSPNESHESHPFYIWSGILTPEHRKQMGISLWTFLWCVRRVTFEKDGLGLVLGGSRIKQSRIARELGVSVRTVGADLERLVKFGYLQTRRIPYGLVIFVLKSKRGFEKRSEESCRSLNGSFLPNAGERAEETSRSRSAISCRNNIEKAVESKQKKRESSGSASPHRKGVLPPKGNIEKPKPYSVDEVIYA